MQDDVFVIERAVSYVRKVSFKMRQYNIDNTVDDNNTDDE
jgi:hypothetical protein